MPQDYHEEWEVIVEKDRFLLNEKQIKVLKDAMNNGMRGVVWFDKFAISIPHVKSAYLKRRYLDQPLIGKGGPLTPDELYPDAAKGKPLREAMDKIRAKLKEIQSS
ncbi:MAG: hypothetical protein KCHDKBKB_00711 [Elusimicrobia bacterium]|nr:hypothetical protein [Elusimicrobiota bacterium]